MTATVVELNPDTFDAFWKVYPRKVGKILARALWDAITGDGLETRIQNRDSGTYIDAFLKATPQEIIDGAKKYEKRLPIKDWSYAEPQFILHPSTWLNRGGWLDG